jgi:LPS sulfotransferase NodH
MQLQALEQSNPPLLQDVLETLLPRDRPRYIVYLRRRDRVAQAVSYARANMSGIWRKEQEDLGSTTLDYSQEQIEAAERGIAFQESVWEQMFSDLGIDPLALWHEDILADLETSAKRVADYLGVNIDPDEAFNAPEIRKQSIGDSAAWVEQYERSRPSA